MAKAQYVGVGNVARKVKQPYVGVSNVARKVKNGCVGVGGVARQFFTGGIPASELTVGSSVYLMESGAAVEYMVVNQGIPSGSSLYDSSCNGTWLLRKDVYGTKVQWHTSAVNAYGSSNVHTYLNNTYLNLFDSNTKSLIKQVKIPYANGKSTTTIYSGTNGLSTKIFLLSGYELGLTKNNFTSRLSVDGALLDYFVEANGSTLRATPSNNGYFMRSVNTGMTSGESVYFISSGTSGGASSTQPTSSYYVRPALILPSKALFDSTTLILQS